MSQKSVLLPGIKLSQLGQSVMYAYVHIFQIQDNVRIYVPIFQIQDHTLRCLQADCEMTAHIFCLAKTFLSTTEQDANYCIPLEGDCPTCGQNLLWGELIRHQHQLQDLKQTKNTIQ